MSAWFIPEAEETDMPGLGFEAYTPFDPGSLPYDSAMAVFCLPDKTAFLQEVKLLNVDEQEPIYGAHFQESLPKYTTGKNRRLH
jgi:hypothetical protein